MGRVAKIWDKYKIALELPAGSKGVLGKIGIALYALLSLVGVIIFYWMINSDKRIFMKTYESTAGDYTAATPHRLPDILACPSKLKNPNMEYTIWYAKRLIEALKMPLEKADNLASMYFSGCNFGKRCPEIQGKCNGDWQRYCSKITEVFKTLSLTNFTRKDLPIPPKKARFLAYREKKYGMSLDLLWLSITDWQYPRVYQLYNKEKNGSEIAETPIHLHIYKQGYDHALIQQANKGMEEVWVGNDLCIAIHGSLVNTTVTPFFGLTRINNDEKWTFDDNSVPYRFWIGNFETMEVTKSSLTTKNHRIADVKDEIYIQPRVSSIVYYSMIDIIQTNTKRKCIDQPFVKGLPKMCQNTQSNDGGTWYYDVSYNTERPFSSLWFYPNTKEKIVQEDTYTLYTQFQIATGILGTCVGLSVFQIVEVVFSSFPKFKFRKFFKFLIYAGVTFVTLIMTAYDTYGYFQDRVSTEFTLASVTTFPVPRIRLCQDKHHYGSFWNTSKFHEYQSSIDLSIFLKMHVWQKTREIPIAFNEERVFDGQNLTGVRIPIWQLQNMDMRNFSYYRLNDKIIISCTEEPCQHYNIFNPTSKLFYDSNTDIATDFHPRFGREFDEVKFEKFSQKIESELQMLAASLGLQGNNLRLVDFTTPFAMSPAEFVWCSHDPNCGKDFDYQMTHEAREEGSSTMCLVLELKNSAQAIRGVGIENGFEIKFDSEKYLTQSDRNEYYGPNTESQQRLNWPEGVCVDPSELGNKSVDPMGCGFIDYISYGLKLMHPGGGTTETTIHLDKNGLTGKNGLAINLKPTFKTLLPWASPCREKSVCKYPKEEILAVTMAIQMEILCGCTYCINKNPRFMDQMRTILKRDNHCCTLKQYLGCYSSNAKTVGYNEDGSYDYLSGSGLAITNLARNYPTSLDAWKSIADLNTFFVFGDRLDNQTKTSIVNFFKSCLEPKCNEESLELSVIQNIPTDGKKDRVLIFYGSDKAKGTQQIDRLDPAQFLGVVSCAYSFTFGISILGLLHVFISKFVNKQLNVSKDKDQMFSGHVIRSIGVFFSKKNDGDTKDCGKDDAMDVKNVNAKQTGGRSNQVAPLDANSQSGKRNEPAKNPRGNHQSEADIISNHESANADPTNGRVSVLSHISRILNLDEEVALERIGNAMFVVLSLIIMSLCILLWYFLTTSNQTETNVMIESKPLINLPSVALCMSRTPGNIEKLEEFLDKSQCQTGSGTPTSCSDVFLIRYKSMNGHCALLDNTRRFDTLEVLHVLLEMTSPKGLNLNLWVSGLNGTDLSSKATTLNWDDRNLILSYSVTMNLNIEGGCDNDEEPRACTRCKRGTEANLCCTSPSDAGRPFPRMIKDSCSKYDYDIAVDNNDKTSDTIKKLKILPKREVMSMFVNRKKLSYVDYFSMIGGFIGSLMELTLLNIICSMIWGSFGFCSSRASNQ